MQPPLISQRGWPPRCDLPEPLIRSGSTEHPGNQPIPQADWVPACCRQIWEDTPGCGDTPFLDSLWTAMDEAVTLKDCDVYSYKSDGEDDPFGAPRWG